MTDPPLLAEGTHSTLTSEPEREVVTVVGAPGTEAAMICKAGEKEDHP
jgi:hypothetical protein